MGTDAKKISVYLLWDLNTTKMSEFTIYMALINSVVLTKLLTKVLSNRESDNFNSGKPSMRGPN